MNRPNLALLAFLILQVSCSLVAGEFQPRPTLQDDLTQLGEVPVTADYRTKRPRLLFTKDDSSALKAKRVKLPGRIWPEVMKQADQMLAEPNVGLIRSGSRYWIAEHLLSGALVGYLDDKSDYVKGVIRWMIAYSKVEKWVPGENDDLGAGWNLYYLSIAYDLLYDSMTKEERDTMRNCLIEHARPVYDKFKNVSNKGHPNEGYRYEQNHTYIPMTGLGAAALALIGETEEANAWLKLSYALMRRCLWVQGNDGYYYEGTSYGRYALHWMIRWADLVERSTGEKIYNIPLFQKYHLMIEHLSLPGSPYTWDIGDSGGHWIGTRPLARSQSMSWNTCLFRFASIFNDRAAQGVAERQLEASSDFGDPGMTYLWYNPQVPAGRIEDLPRGHYFPDHEIFCWRSSWQADATIMMFKCGPPEGHAVTAKIPVLKDWFMNAGHVHPDIGSFWLFAKGQYLAVDTGYTQRKRVRDHNTIIVGGRGQGNEDNYWSYRNLPYEMFDKAKIEKTFLHDSYAYVSGEFGSVYHPVDQGGRLTVRRHVVCTESMLVTYDEIQGTKANDYGWMLHADSAFTKREGYHEVVQKDVKMLVYGLLPEKGTAKNGEFQAFRGKLPHKGKDEVVGHQLLFELPQKAEAAHFLVVMLPMKAEDKAPDQVSLVERSESKVTFRIRRNGAEQTFTVDLAWKKLNDGKTDSGPLSVK